MVGAKDWQLVELAVAEDYTLVTHNAIDFRGAGPGKLAGQHAKQPIHAGLLCLNSVHVMGIERQRDLFHLALDELAVLPDLVNQALEVFEAEDGSVSIDIYDIPGQA